MCVLFQKYRWKNHTQKNTVQCSEFTDIFVTTCEKQGGFVVPSKCCLAILFPRHSDHRPGLVDVHYSVQRWYNNVHGSAVLSAHIIMCSTQQWSVNDDSTANVCTGTLLPTKHITLHWIELLCTIISYTALHWNTLYCNARHHTTMHRTELHCNS